MTEKGQNSNYDYKDSEINLIDIWFLIYKRKWIFIGIFLLSLIIGFIYLFYTNISFKPTYVSNAIIRIGQIGREATTQGSTIPIEDRALLLQQLREQNDGTSKLPRLDSAEQDPSNDYSIILSTSGASPNEAQQNLVIITDALMKRHQQIYNQMREIQQKNLDSLIQKLKDVNIKIKLFDQILKSNNNASGAVLVLQRESLEEIRLGLELRIANQEMAMSELLTRPTQFIRNPTLNQSPVGVPSKKMPLFLAIITGIVLGLLAVFMVEFFAKYKDQITKGIPDTK